jgi:hypothetical protein
MPSNETIRAAWITGFCSLAGAVIAAIVAAVFTSGFGLIHSSPATPTPEPPQTTSAPPTTASPPNEAAVPSSYQGTWSGVVTQSNGPPFQITLKIGAGSVGDLIGSWQLPTFNCSGTIGLNSGGGPLQLYQATNFNGAGECYSHFTSSVALQGSSLIFEIIGATSTSGVFSAGNPTLAFGTLSPSN